jgi:hypothetical protein
MMNPCVIRFDHPAASNQFRLPQSSRLIAASASRALFSATFDKHQTTHSLARIVAKPLFIQIYYSQRTP